MKKTNSFLGGGVFLSMSKPLILITLSVFLVFKCSAQLNPGLNRINVPLATSGGYDSALVYLPSDYFQTTQNYPILYFIRGSGEVGTTLNPLFRQGVAKALGNGHKMTFTNPVDGKTYKFIVVCVQDPSQWLGNNVLNDYLNYFSKNFRVDQSRMYMTGLSAGGWSTWNFITTSKLGLTLAAAAPVSTPDGNTNSCVVDSFPEWLNVGNADAFYNGNVAFYNGVKQCNPNAPIWLTVWNGYGHSAALWDSIYNAYAHPYIASDTLYRWFLRFTNTKNQQTQNSSTPNALIAPVSPITLPLDSVNLDGSGSTDQGGTLTSYRWSQISGPSTATIQNPIGSKTEVTNLVAGTYVFSLGIADNLGATANTNITVTVQAAQPPVPVIGTINPVTLPLDSVTLDGSASTDPAGTITSYTWAQVSGPSSALIQNPAGSTTVVTNLVAGTYIFSLSVTDSRGISVNTSVSVTVNAPGNLPPVAIAGNNQTITLPLDSVFLDGTQSTTASGSIVSFSWAEISGPANAGFSQADSATTEVRGLLAGTYQFSLTVTNSLGLSGMDVLSVTVNPDQSLTIHKRIYLPVPFKSNWYPNVDSMLNIQPGDTICIPAGDYANFSFANIHGAPGEPVVIQNCGGVVRVGVNNTAGFNFILDHCSYFELSGSGTPGIEYGFEMVGTPASQGGKEVNGVVFQNKTDNFDAHNIFINHSRGSGIVCLTRAICSDPGTWRQNYVMENIKFHHIKMIGTGFEGFYIGRTRDYQIDSTCSLGDTLFNPFFRNLEVYDNYQDSIGNGAIQVSLANYGNNRIYNNVVIDAGLNGGYGMGVGISIGGNGHADIYNNFIKNDHTLAMQILGAGLTRVYNNVMVNGTSDAIQCTGISTTGPLTFDLFNNTIVNPAGNGITIYGSKSTVPNLIFNNLMVAVNHPTYGVPATGIYIPPAASVGYQVLFQYLNNIYIQNLSQAGFVNPAGDNYHLTPQSPAIDAGRDLSSYGITTDFDGNHRPYGAAYDVGAYEYQGTPNPNRNPVANAGGNITITLPSNSVTLNGSGSFDPGSTLVSYTWQLLSGPTGSQLLTPQSVESIASFLQPGVYVFQLTVKDSLGLSASDSAIVTVNPASGQGQLPIANAGSNITITLPNDSVNLNGSGSSDPGGTITSYSWNEISGPSQYSILSGNSASTPVSNLVQGTYVFGLTIKDNKGQTASAQVTVNVNPVPNLPPVANAGPNQTITLPTNTVTLNGSASHDPDGSIVSFMWTESSGSNQYILKSPDSSTTVVSNLMTGTYVFNLTVTDNQGATSSSQVTITVNAGPDIPPVAVPGSNITLTLPLDSLTLNGNASYDQDGTITNYNWKEISGPSALTLPSGVSQVPLKGLIAGTYVFQLSVTDNQGASDSATRVVTVNPGLNQPPVANAGQDTSIILPVDSVTLNGTASMDPDGTITTYSWTQISGPSSATLGSPSSPVTIANNLRAGIYVFSLSVTDNSGAQSSAMVRIVVNPSGSIPPVANAGGNITIFFPTDSAFLNGTASSSSSGSITSYSWTVVSGPAGALIGDSILAQTEITGLQPGTYTIGLTVTDNTGAQGYAQITLTVSPGPGPVPVANAGSSQTLTLPVNNTLLDGSASSEAGGTIVSYTWNKVSGPSQFNLLTPTGDSTQVNNLVVGTYVFSLTVTDSLGNSSTDTTSVTVLPQPNIPPVAIGPGNASITLPWSQFILDASKSYDPDGRIVSYLWTQLSGPAGDTIQNSSGITTTLSGLVQGTYNLSLTVTDNRGASGSDTFQLIVNPAPPEPPVAMAGPNLVMDLPNDSATLNGSQSYAPSGNIVSYLWVKDQGPSQYTLTGANTAIVNLYNLTVGTYVFKLTVTDNLGNIGTDSVMVTVNPLPNLPPVADAGPDTTLVLPQNSTILDGSHSYDPDGQVVFYSWSQLAGPSQYTAGNLDSSVLVLSNLSSGSYVFQLTVTDNNGATSTDQVQVNVQLSQDGAKGMISLYPDPATTNIHVFFFNKDNGLVQVTIFDMNGKALSQYQFTKDHVSSFNQDFDISNLPSGMFILEVKFNAFISSAKFVKITP